MTTPQWITRLALKWNLKSTTQVIIVLVVFTCTGFTVMWAKERILTFVLGDDGNTTLASVLYYIFILPIYNVVLLFYGFVFGQFSFFWEFEKRTFRQIRSLIHKFGAFLKRKFKLIMNRLLILALAAVTLASCSAPKYTYNFDHYDYNAGKRKKAETAVAVAPVAEEKVVSEEPVLTASTSAKPVTLKSEVAKTKSNAPVSYKDLSREEKKEFRKELRNEFKKYVQAVKKGEKISTVGQNPNGSLDPDVKMAIIFGAVGVVLFILGGVSEVFTILGAIALLVGVYFLVKWLIRQ